ncbi:MAG: response regulator transcription factor, partial [Bryobacteraceae bacterium]
VPQDSLPSLGVRAILRRTAPAGMLLDCLVTVGQGGRWREPAPARQPASRLIARLTPRERQILSLLCRGMRNKQIARELAIAPGTVKVHLMRIFEKTGARNRYELAVGAWRLGLDQSQESRAE